MTPSSTTTRICGSAQEAVAAGAAIPKTSTARIARSAARLILRSIGAALHEALGFSPVELRWTPEPTPDEREALERALLRLLAEPDDPRGAWWRAGVEESVFLEDESQD